MKITNYLCIILGALVFLSCESADNSPVLEIPTAYDGSNFTTNAAAELEVRTSLAAMTAELQKGRTGGQVDLATATSFFEKVRPVTTPYYANKVTADWLPKLVAASGGARMEKGVRAGVFGPYLMNAQGLEYEQLIEKGLFGAALYNHAVAVLNNPIDATTSDKILAIYGAHPDFPNSNNRVKHANADGFTANYVARRDKNDGNGYYTIIKNALIKLQAAGKAGSAFKSEQDEAANVILSTWEKGSAATVVNYLHAAIAKLSATELNEADESSAMHSFGEALGFLYGLKNINNKVITDSQIDELLKNLNFPVGQEAQTLKFLTNRAEELPKMVNAITQLQQIYGFSNSEIEDFKKNWVVEQSR